MAERTKTRSAPSSTACVIGALLTMPPSCASLLGILGALLAIPIAAAIQILPRDWWTHRSAAFVSDAYAPAQNGSSAELVQP